MLFCYITRMIWLITVRQDPVAVSGGMMLDKMVTYNFQHRIMK